MNCAQDLRMLGNLHEENGEYQVARQLYSQALLAQKRRLGKESSELVPFIYDLAMINAVLEEDKEARDLFAWLLQIIPPQHALVSEVRMVLNELALSLDAA